ncbi:MAG: isoprenylcysteine carboxylmethyltransferase family protein [Xanthomonadales bacterium]|nr:isoprenylcysteine carboxylmethyltransferase family protein [Xanthomonadales bacterium]
MRRLGHVELKVPPALLLVAAALAIRGVAALAPWARINLPGRFWIAALLIVVGIAVAALGAIEFGRQRTTVDPMHPEKVSSLVTSGVFGFSRNPMYLGFLLVLLGGVAWTANALSLLPVLAFALYLTRFQIIPEERWMQRQFGDDYDAYRQRVRRWI